MKHDRLKRIFSVLLCLCMMVSYLPAAAHAAETACSCTTACTEESINTDCPVCGVEGADLESCALHVHTQESEPVETTTPTETVEETEAPVETTAPTEDVVEETVDEAVVAVQGMIDALPDVETATEDELASAYDAVQAAYDAYESLTAEQMEKIDLTRLISLMEWYNGQVEPLAGQTVTLSGADTVTINQANMNDYMNNTLTGSMTGGLVIDGEFALTMTIRDLSIVRSQDTSGIDRLSAIELKNGANLHLTIEGENTLTGDNGGAGIYVPNGCLLNIESGSTGSLTAKGATGIGAVASYNNNTMTVGKITIAGGAVNATGNVGAGIGGTYGASNAQIEISGGTVNAKGGSTTAAGGGKAGAAGIGGGVNGSVFSITISGGTVTATRGDASENCHGAAIGSGYDSSTSTSSMLPCGNITITGGTVTANGNIGFGDTRCNGYKNGGSISITGGEVDLGDYKIIAGTTNSGTVDQDCIKRTCNLILTVYGASLAAGTGTVTIGADGNEKQWKDENVSFTVEGNKATANVTAKTTLHGEQPIKVTLNGTDYTGTIDLDSQTDATIGAPTELVVTDVSGCTYTYNNGYLVFNGNGSATVTMAKDVETTDHQIQIADGASVTLTLQDVKMNATDKGRSIITVANGSTLTLVLAGTNSMESAVHNGAVVNAKEATLTIQGTGSLAVKSTSSAADRKQYNVGIWSNNMTIDGDPTLNVQISRDGIGIRGTSITVNGGNIASRPGTYGMAGIGEGYDFTGTVTITGGTIYAEGGYLDASGGGIANPYTQAIIAGGSVNMKRAYDGDNNEIDTLKQPKNTGNTLLYCTTITVGSGDTLSKNAKVTGLTIVSGNSQYTYGIENMYTDNDGKLYLWLPANATVTQVKTVNGTYTGTCTTNTSTTSNNNGNIWGTAAATFTISGTMFVPVTDITLGTIDKVGEFDLSSLATLTPDNATNNNVTWSIEGTNTAGAAIENNTTLKIAQLGSFTLKVTVANGKAQGENFVKTFPIKIMATATLENLKLDGWTYGDAANTPTYTSNSGTRADAVVEYKAQGADDSAYSTTVPTNAGNYTLRVTLPATDAYSGVSDTVDFTIVQKALTIKAKDQTIVYGGSIAKGASQYEVTGLESGDSCTSVTLTPSGTDVTTSGAITPSAAKITNSTGDMTANYSITYQEGKLVINKADATCTPPTPKTGLTYNGRKQELVEAGSATGGELQYKLGENGTYSTAIPTRTDAGTYTVYYKVVGDSNHNGIAAQSVQVTIAKGTPTVTAPTASNITYGQPLSAATLSNSAWSWVNGATIPAVGSNSYPAKMTVDDANYDYTGVTGYDASAHTVTRTISVSVDRAEATLTPPAAISGLTYNGEAQALVTAGSSEHGEMQYSLSESGSYSADIPTGTDATTYTVWYKVIGDANHKDSTPASVNVTIAPKSISGAVIQLDNIELTYNGSVQTKAIQSVELDGKTLTKDTDYTVSGNQQTSAGSYTLKVEGKGNYTGTATASWSISKADATYTAPTAKTELVYTGGTLGLINAGGTTDGEMQYSLTKNEGYSTTIPTGQNARTYTVYYKVVGDSNHSNIEVQSISVTIAKAPLTITDATVANKIYDGTTAGTVTSVAFSGLVNGETLTMGTDYTATAEFQSANVDQNIPATVTVTLKNTNYALSKSTYVRAGAKIDRADRSAPTGVSAVDETIFGKNDGKITGLTTDDDYYVGLYMEYRKDSETGYTRVTKGNTELTGLEPGKYYIRYAQTRNYNASTDTMVEIKAGRKLTITLPTEQEGYELTSTVTDSIYNDSVTLYFKLKPGYTRGKDFKITATNGTVTYFDGKYILSDITADTTVYVTGVVDETAPTAEITVENNGWKTFLNAITFDRFFKEKQDVTITASDAGSGVDKISYYLSNSPLTLEQVKALADTDWTEYAGKFSISAEQKYIVYAKVTDNWGNATHISSDGLILDMTAPVISGVENGKTYYTTQKVTAKDTYPESLTGTEADGIIPGDVDKVYIIEATDKAGNSTTFTITMKPISSIREGLPTMDTVKITDKDAIEAVKATASNVLASQCTNATAEEKAKLEQIITDCDALLKAIQNAENAIKRIEAMPDAKKTQPDDKAAIDAYEAAKSAYDKLTESEKRMVGDENKAKLDAMFAALTAYDIIKGDGSTWTKGSTSGLTFTANGYFGKFTEIKVDGVTVDAKNYEAQSGSTVITLKASYLQTLKTGKHTIQVVYRDGATDEADTFTIKAAAGTTGGNSTTNGVSSPGTGDHSHMALWISLLCVSVAGMAALLLVNKKRRSTK